MIVGINYNQDGSRSIAYMFYDVSESMEEKKHHALIRSRLYDEVYIVSLDNNCQDFINEIVTKGCRIV